MSLIIENIKRIRCSLCGYRVDQAPLQSIPSHCPACQDKPAGQPYYGPYGYGNSQPYS